MGSRELHVESATLGKFDHQNKKVKTKMRLFVAMILVASVTNAGILRHRIASDLPSRDDVAAAFAQMKDMKLSELANVLKNSEAVRNSYRRAAMDMQEHDGLSKMVKRLASNPKIHQAIQNFVEEGDNLFVRDLTNLRQKTSPDFQSSVRAALDSMMSDEGSRPLATHLKQAWDADSVDEQLKHLNMALDVLDSSADGASDNVNQADAEDGDDEAGEEDAGEGDATTDDSETADDADADVDANADEEEEDENLNQADNDDDDDDDDDIEDDDESFEFEEEEEEEEEDE